MSLEVCTWVQPVMLLLVAQGVDIGRAALLLLARQLSAAQLPQLIAARHWASADGAGALLCMQLQQGPHAPAP